MKRLILLLEILLLVSAMAAVVLFRSPYAPVVSGVVEIEELWAIEDTRQESDQPLITALQNHGIPLAFDENENTFYCTLGLDNGEEWPDIHLTAPGAQGVSICFSDDYTFDWCHEAIAEGYSYELMAYTDTEYSYFYIVFTGLPLVSLSYDGEMTTEDIPVTFEMGSYGMPKFSGGGRAHLRGDGSLAWAQKPGYKVEFTRRADGTGKIAQSVPGFVQTDEVLLLPMAFDETLMLDRLSWAMYGLITPDTEAFSARRTQYVEVFVNHSYAGVYLMAEPFAIDEELAKANSHAASTDSLYRTSAPSMGKDRPMLLDSGSGAPGYEMFYTTNQQEPFAALESYIGLWNEEDDEAFMQKALSCVDIDSAVRYLMFLEAAGLADNATNNLYIWAHTVEGCQAYRFKPWDMDRSWGIDAGNDFEGWFAVPVIDRIVNLDVGGARAKLFEVWEDMKRKGFSYETVETLVSQYMHELNDSGAFLRNTYRWGVDAAMADGSRILNFCSMRFPMLDEAIARIYETDGLIDFLSTDIRRGDSMVTPMIDLTVQ